MAELPKGELKSLTKPEMIGVVSSYLLGAKQRGDLILEEYYEGLLGELLGPNKLKG
jgi:hypothetical protein